MALERGLHVNGKGSCATVTGATLPRQVLRHFWESAKSLSKELLCSLQRALFMRTLGSRLVKYSLCGGKVSV